MVYRKGELTKARINRDWPHQLALPVELATGKNYTILDRFCRVCPFAPASSTTGVMVSSTSHTASASARTPSMSRFISAASPWTRMILGAGRD